MLEKLHDHMVDELAQNSRTDTIVLIVALIFNLIIIGTNSNTAQQTISEYGSAYSGLLLVVFMTLSVVVNAIALVMLRNGRETRNKLVKGLQAMYADSQVDRYYDPSLLSGYSQRYGLYMAVLVVLLITSLVVPMIIRVMG